MSGHGSTRRSGRKTRIPKRFASGFVIEGDAKVYFENQIKRALDKNIANLDSDISDIINSLRGLPSGGQRGGGVSAGLVNSLVMLVGANLLEHGLKYIPEGVLVALPKGILSSVSRTAPSLESGATRAINLIKGAASAVANTKTSGAIVKQITGLIYAGGVAASAADTTLSLFVGNLGIVAVLSTLYLVTVVYGINIDINTRIIYKPVRSNT